MSAEDVVVAHFIPDMVTCLLTFLFFKELTLSFIEFSPCFKFHSFCSLFFLSSCFVPILLFFSLGL